MTRSTIGTISFNNLINRLDFSEGVCSKSLAKKEAYKKKSHGLDRIISTLTIQNSPNFTTLSQKPCFFLKETDNGLFQ